MSTALSILLFWFWLILLDIPLRFVVLFHCFSCSLLIACYCRSHKQHNCLWPQYSNFALFTSVLHTYLYFAVNWYFLFLQMMPPNKFSFMVALVTWFFCVSNVDAEIFKGHHQLDCLNVNLYLQRFGSLQKMRDSSLFNRHSVIGVAYNSDDPFDNLCLLFQHHW